MLKTGKSYCVSVVDHFSSNRQARDSPLEFYFVGKYVRTSTDYVIFSIDKDLTPEGQFLVPLSEADEFMHVLKGRFKATPYSEDSASV
jgi:hypothetical protein